MSWFRRASAIQVSLAAELNLLLEASVREANEFKASIAPLHTDLGEMLRQELALPVDQPRMQWAGDLQVLSEAHRSLSKYLTQLHAESNLWFQKAPSQHRDVWAQVDQSFVKAFDQVFVY
jgi:hypothetical protein